MTAAPVIVPWIVPEAPAELLAVFDAADTDADALSIGRQSLPIRHCIQSDARETRMIRRVDVGLLSQGVANHRLNKPVAMNLYPAGTLSGFLNVFTGIPTPRILKTLQPSRVTEMPQHHFRRRLTENQDLLIRYAEYVELASKSELIGMEALFTLGLAERAALWFASSLFYAGINPLEAGDEYLRLNFQVTRTALCNIIYTTKAPLDRLFAELFRNGTLLRMGSERLVRRSDLAAMSEWILTH